jgi:hypothetical protein
MRTSRRTTTLFCAATLTSAALAFGGTVVAAPIEIGPDVTVEIGGAFTSQAPFQERIRSVGGGHPPALKELRVRAVKKLGIDLENIPPCKLGGRGPRRSVAEVRKACGRAVVGSGQIAAEVEFEGQRPVDLSSELLLLKSASSGGAALYLYAYLGAPATEILIAPVTVKGPGDGVFGPEAIARIPEIAGGSGSITYFRLGLRRSIFRPACIAGRPWLHVDSVFEDGTRLSAALVRSCPKQKALRGA